MRIETALSQNRLETPRLNRARITVEPLSRLRAVVLLGGTVRPTQLSRAVGRSLLELPIQGGGGPTGNAGRTVMDLWQDHTDSLAHALEVSELPLRIMIDQQSRAPETGRARGRARPSVERDPAAFRGTGGVLRDVCTEYAEDDVVLVANAGQIMVEPLQRLAQELSEEGGDVSLLAHDDGTPVGIMLVRCGLLRGVRANGFVDFKEQVLPRMADDGAEIRVVRRARATGLAVRTLDGYIGALRALKRMSEGRAALGDALDEDWRPTFSIIEDGASVDPSATIHDSVILRGATVGRGAVVVRSVVCPGEIIRDSATVADKIVARHRERAQGRAA